MNQNKFVHCIVWPYHIQYKNSDTEQSLRGKKNKPIHLGKVELIGRHLVVRREDGIVVLLCTSDSNWTRISPLVQELPGYMIHVAIIVS